MKQNKSFDPNKCLLYRKNLEGLLTGKWIAPVEVDIDPINACTLKCVWCNSKRVLNGDRIEKDDMTMLLNMLAEWGVSGICFAGGGEPSLHPDLSLFIEYCTGLGLETAIITNGYSWNDNLIKSMARNMRWIGISVDTGDWYKFKELKKVDGFVKVLENIKRLVTHKREIGSNVGITYKYLIHPVTQYNIVETAMLAKKIGCDSFHLRPVDFLAYQDNEEQLDVPIIKEQIEAGMTLNDDTFEFIPYFNCFNSNYNRVVFDKCLLSPLLGICLPDGWWLCIDRKGDKRLKLCKINEIREFWGSDKHLEIINSINPKVDCGKCTLSKYYSIFDSYINDDYYRSFP